MAANWRHNGRGQGVDSVSSTTASPASGTPTGRGEVTHVVPSVPGALGVRPSMANTASGLDRVAPRTSVAGPGPGRPPGRRRRPADTRWVAALVAGDLLAAALAVPVALVALSAVSASPADDLARLGTNLRLDGWFPLATVATLALAGTYRSSRLASRSSTASGLKDRCLALGAGCLLALGLSDAAHAAAGWPMPDPTQLLVAVPVALALATAVRAALGWAVGSRHPARVLVVGSGSLVERIELYLRIDRGMELVGRVDDGDVVTPGSLGPLRDLPALVGRLGVDRVIVAHPERGAAWAGAVLREVQDRVHLAIVPRYFELVSWRSAVTDLSGLPLLEVASADLSGWDRAAKRAVDLVVATVGLVLTLPLTLAVAVAVKATSPGPVLFRQVRLGRGARPFTIVKFRTMTTGTAGTRAGGPAAEDDAHRPLKVLRAKTEELARATRVGSVLRRTGLDELPQLVNVLLGQMSVVGPRPFVPEESEGLEGWAARRFEVRPGLTGLWQISGRNELSTEDLRQLDYVYVASWSLWWDLKILWDTPRAMVRGLGVY